jgi:diguanylate cyclase (GGDEF)-like protein
MMWRGGIRGSAFDMVAAAARHTAGARTDAVRHRGKERGVRARETAGITTRPIIEGPRRRGGDEAVTCLLGRALPPVVPLQPAAWSGVPAVDHVAAVAAAHEARRTAEVLLGFSRQLLTAEGAAAVTRLTAAAAQSIGGCDGATVWLWNDGARAFTLAGHAGCGADDVRRMRSLVIRPDDHPALSTWPQRPLRPALHEVETAGPDLRHLFEAFGCEAFMVAPMAASGRPHGLVVAAWLRGGTPAPQAAPAFDRLAGIADQATAALQRATLLDQARMQAFKDELTGLANRRHLGLLLRETLQRITATETAGLLFLDLDDFKHVNDSLGHSAGDLLLQRVARRLQRCVRGDDVVARLGGDEFTVLLPAGRGSEELPVVAGRILQAFTEPIEIAGRPVTVRPSIGGVVVTADRADPAELLRHADIAMYTAKRAGGARMVVYDEACGDDRGRFALAAGCAGYNGLPLM